jgi:hypothetical protein
MGTVMSTLMAPAGTIVEREAKKNLHGALMIWAWGVFIPGGLLLVRVCVCACQRNRGACRILHT